MWNVDWPAARSGRSRARVKERDGGSSELALGPKLIQGGSREGRSETYVAAIADAFERFWRIYPHRGEFSDPKKPAREKFEAAVKRGVDPAVIIEGAKRFRLHVEGRGTEPRFRPQAKTWISQEHWTQSYDAAAPRLRVGMN